MQAALQPVLDTLNAMPVWLIVLIKSAILLLVVITTFAYAMLGERKIMGWMQLRPGPNRRRTVGIDAARRRRRQSSCSRKISRRRRPTL